MKKLFLSGLSAALFVPSVLAQPDPIYENFGVVDFGTNAPQINATAFANYGSFSVFTLLPFDTQNTLFYTNRGDMFGSVGFRFEHVPPLGPTKPAAWFVNELGATIDAFEGLTSIFDDGLLSPNYLLIDATNVINRGLFSAGSAGQLRVEGRNVDLARGGLQISPIVGGAGANLDPTNFFPEVGITDLIWQTNINNGFDVSTILSGSTVRGGPITLQNPIFGVFTNASSPTNIQVQATFLGLSDPDFQFFMQWTPGTIPTNFLRTAKLGLAMVSSNEVIDTDLFSTLFLIDTLGSETNRELATNLLATPTTFRPANYQLSRQNIFPNGPGPNSGLTPDLFYNTTFSNQFVTNFNTYYVASVDYLPERPPVVEGFTPEQNPGRIEIKAESLDLSHTRMRGEGYISIETDHLISNVGALMEAENISYLLNSTNGNLLINSLARQSMRRLGGQMEVWSAVWTNFSSVLETNTMMDTNSDPPMTVTNVTTNVLEYGFHILLVDGTGLQTRHPISIYNFRTKSTNTVLADDMTVTNTFRIEGETFHLQSDLAFGNQLRTWRATNAPNLKHFTNSGSFSAFSSADFGNDTARPYESFVNLGSINTFSLGVRSTFFQNNGALNGSGRFTLEALSARLEEGNHNYGGDVRLFVNDLKLRQYNHISNQRLFLSITNSLSDNGAGSGNTLNCGLGFHLLRKPVIGDLLGTRVQSSAPQFAEVFHSWAAEDRGATAAGYSNNVALGRLVLSGGRNSLLTFSGTGTNNALYVDLLDISALDDLEADLNIEPNLTIYYADATTLAEELDGQLNGRLRWVSEFAGPNTSVDVLNADGTTVTVNRALRNSTTIDSDGDGVANFFDFFPFDPEVWAAASVTQSGGSPALTLSWNAIAGREYVVEYTTSLESPNWEPLTNYTGFSLEGGRITIIDPNALASDAMRFYRVRFRSP